MTGLGIDDFLGHETNTRGGGKFLSKWKSRTPPEVRIWLHTRALIVPLWQHGIPQVRTFDDKDTGQKVRKIWGGNFNCLEHETVLQLQNKRTDSGSREVPPTICPMCLLLEHVRMLVNTKQITKVHPVFVFKTEDFPDSYAPTEDEIRVLSAGGFCDMFKGTLSPAEKLQIRQAHISLQDAWRENGRAKCNYVFSVVDHDNLDDGVQIAIETSLLGDKTKQVIRDQMKRLGRDEGNPLLNPYAFQWEHHKKEAEFQKKYHVLDMPRLKLTDEIAAAIRDTEPPDLSNLTRPGNVRALRAALEQYAVIDLPWDQLFGAAEAQQAAQQGQEDEEQAAELDDPAAFDFGANAAPVTAQVPAAVAATPAPAVVAPAPVVAPATPTAPATAAPATSKRSKAAAPPPPVEPMGDPCDECQHPMKASETKCPGCGQEYNIVPEAPVPAGPAPTLAAAPAAAPAAQPTGTVLGADGVVAGSKADKLNW